MAMNILDALRRAWNLGFSAALAKPPASQQGAMLEDAVQRVAAEYEVQRTKPAVDSVGDSWPENDLPDGTERFGCMVYGPVRLKHGMKLYAHPLDMAGGYFIGGPRATAIVHDIEHAEAVITALCQCTGDDADDYTVTDLSANPEKP